MQALGPIKRSHFAMQCLLQALDLVHICQHYKPPLAKTFVLHQKHIVQDYLFIAVHRIVLSAWKTSCPMCLSYPLWHEDLKATCKASSFLTQKIVDIIFAKLLLFSLEIN
jgi:hypothetical protein